tara:strand:- start:630 stop:1139 length:510 start_codon:yes stop_codon:yes gene_type:complete
MEGDVVQRIVKYLTDTIEQPREEFSNFPVCPFAKSERLSGRLKIGVFDPGKTDFVEMVANMKQEGYDSGLFAVYQDDIPVEISAKDTKKMQTFLNKSLRLAGMKKYKTICFNPNDEVGIDGFNPRSHSPFFLVNVASRDVLNAAHKSLTKTKYFDKLSKQYREFLKLDL